MADMYFTPEYIEMAEKYEEKFGEPFSSYMYDAEECVEIMKDCIKKGKPYDVSKEPNYDPDAKY